MKSSITKSLKKPEDIVITLIFNAPLVMVWQAWTNPGYLKKWWGPKNFSCPYSDINLHTGGRYLHCKRSPEGRDYWSTGTYLNIINNEQLGFTHSYSDYRGNIVPASFYGIDDGYPLESLVTINFKATGAKTRMSFRQTGLPEGTLRKRVIKNWKQSFEKLAASLS